MAYTRKQLDAAWSHQDKTENGPSRQIFEELLKRAREKKDLTYAEAEYLCNGLRFSKKEEDGKTKDFEICGDYLFRHLYVRYAFDLHGVGAIMNNKTEFTTAADKRLDVDELEQISQKWEVIIKQSNHPNQALNYLAKETRSEIKELEKQPEFNDMGFLRRCNHFDFRKKRIVLHSKFIYSKYQEIMSEIEETDRTFTIGGLEIEFNEYSFIHILFRHYAEIVKQTPNTKTYHIPDFSPDEIVHQLKQLFFAIESSGKFKGQSIHEIDFKFKGKLYRVWVNERIKSIKGKGNLKYNRLETFFPLADAAMLKDLHTNFVEEIVSNEISIFVPRAAVAV
jgi:hypothetical protein